MPVGRSRTTIHSEAPKLSDKEQKELLAAVEKMNLGLILTGLLRAIIKNAAFRAMLASLLGLGGDIPQQFKEDMASLTREVGDLRKELDALKKDLS